jgi:hypothetical protein
MSALISVQTVEFDQIGIGEFANAFRIGEKLDPCDALASELLQRPRIVSSQKSADFNQMPGGELRLSR